MTKETIKQIILKADDGMYLTNGKTYGKTVILPNDTDIDIWYEITEEQYQNIMLKEAGV